MKSNVKVCDELTRKANYLAGQIVVACSKGIKFERAYIATEDGARGHLVVEELLSDLVLPVDAMGSKMESESVRVYLEHRIMVDVAGENMEVRACGPSGNTAVSQRDINHAAMLAESLAEADTKRGESPSATLQRIINEVDGFFEQPENRAAAEAVALELKRNSSITMEHAMVIVYGALAKHKAVT